ncbi:MAG: response regulator transcription factor [Thermodesulfobacteriota bacterium]
MTVRIVLADDHNIVREGLRSLIEKEMGLEVVGEAEDGRTTVRLAAELKPDLVIMDVSMPDLNGIEATRQITREQPGTRVLALSMHSDKRFVAGILKAGASGYLLKDCAFEEMAGAIKAVVTGGTYLSPAVAGPVIHDYVRGLKEGEFSTSTLLTAREREVLQLLAEGHTTKDIATRLNVSVKTVETHRRQLMDKLDLHTVAALTKFAIREGLTTLDS